MRVLFNFKIGETTLVLFSLSVIFLILSIIVLLVGKKKNKVSIGKKLLTGLLLAITTFGFAVTALAYYNVVPLSLHLGYYQEVDDFDGDGKTSGYKITMDRVYYYQNFETDRLDKQSDGKGNWRLKNTFVEFMIKDNNVTYEVRSFGKELYINETLAYIYVHDIEVR